jgi:hypothetical protein
VSRQHFSLCIVQIMNYLVMCMCTWQKKNWLLCHFDAAWRLVVVWVLLPWENPTGSRRRWKGKRFSTFNFISLFALACNYGSETVQVSLAFNWIKKFLTEFNCIKLITLPFLWIMLTATSIPLKLHQSKSMFNKLIHIIISLTMIPL